MPEISKEILLEQICEALQKGNCLFQVISDQHPFRIKVFKGDESYNLLIYIWTLTHGGGQKRPKDEYRIQITGLPSNQLKFPAGYRTLLLGWYPQRAIFAGFDAHMHQTFTGRSPSVQIKIRAIEDAARYGFGFHQKENNEIAVAFAPYLFIDYVVNQPQFHQFGAYPQETQLLEQVVQQPEFNETIIQQVPKARREVISVVKRKLREWDFRTRVLTAYNHSCAVCGIQLELVEAAHIIPVGAPGSNDQTKNGLALCSLHHDAYDKAIIAINEDYFILTSKRSLYRLRNLDRAGGERRFLENLHSKIHLPRNELDYPDPEYLKRGMELRHWKA